MRSLSFLLVASVALTLPSFSPTPCSALQLAGPPLAGTIQRSFHSMANGPTTVFIPTYGTVSLPSYVDPSSIPGYDASTGSVSNQYAQQAIQYLSQYGLIDVSSTGVSSNSTGVSGGPNGGISNFNSTGGSSTGIASSSSTGVGSGNSTVTGQGNGNGNGNGNGGGSQGTPNAAGATSSLSWKVGAAAVVLGLSAVAGAVGVV